MSQSHIEAETTPTLGSSEMRDYQDYQRVLNVATTRCEEIEQKIVALTVEHVELNVELAEARKEVAHLEEARRPVSVVPTTRTKRIVMRMLGKISEALDKIDDIEFLPDTIGLRLESMLALPYAALSDNAATAYTELALHIKETEADPKLLAPLQQDVLDVVCFACCRFIDPLCKMEYRESFHVAFGGSVDKEIFGRLGNSRYQLFERDFLQNPAREPGYKETKETTRNPRRRKRSPRHKRSISEPISEPRSITFQ